MKIRATSTDVTNVEADSLVVSFFHDERPLKGHTGLADWRLCGLLSRYIIQGRIGGDLGEKILFPMNHRMRCDKVVAMGLGEKCAYSDEIYTNICHQFAKTIFKLQVHDFALGLPGSILEGFDAGAAAAKLCEEVGGRFRRDRDMFKLLNLQILATGPALKEITPIVAKYEHRYNEELKA